MTDIEDLIADARKYGPESMSSQLIRKLADALEGQLAESDRRGPQTVAWHQAVETQRFRALKAEAKITAALEVTRSASVPLGVPEALHYDRLLAEVRRVLLSDPLSREHDRDRDGICRRCGQGITAADVLDGEGQCND